VLRSQTLRCRASVFNIWYLFCTQNWSLYFNLLTSGVDFARIRRVFGLSSQNRFLFGLLPITEGKSLGSALLPRISNITEKLLYKSGAFWLWFCWNQSVVTGLEKKEKNSLAYFRTQGHKVGGRYIVPWWRHIREAGSWICYLLVVILQKLVSGHWFWKKTKFLWPTSEHRGQEFGERSIVP